MSAVNDTDNNDQKKIDAIKQAIKNGAGDLLELELSEQINTKGLNLFILAQKENEGELFYILHANNVDINEQDENGRTALHYAAMNIAEDDIKDLIILGANRTIKDNNGYTAYDLFEQELKNSQELAQQYLCPAELQPAAPRRTCAASIEELHRKLDEMRNYQEQQAATQRIATQKTAAQIWAERLAPIVGDTLWYAACYAFIYIMLK